MKHEKRSSEKAQQRDAESRKTYKDYNWEGMFQDGTLSKLKATAVELDKYTTYHKLGKLKTKEEKIEAIKWNIMRQLSRQIEQAIDEEGSEDGSDSKSGEDSDEEDCVLAEIWDSSSEEEVEGESESAEMSASVMFTRSGMRVTRFII